MVALCSLLEVFKGKYSWCFDNKFLSSKLQLRSLVTTLMIKPKCYHFAMILRGILDWMHGINTFYDGIRNVCRKWVIDRQLIILDHTNSSHGKNSQLNPMEDKNSYRYLDRIAKVEWKMNTVTPSTSHKKTMKYLKHKHTVSGGTSNWTREQRK